MTWNIESDTHETLETIAERRQWRLEQLEQTTELLARKVRDEYGDETDITNLAKRARVSRPTIYRWIESKTSKS